MLPSACCRCMPQRGRCTQGWGRVPAGAACRASIKQDTGAARTAQHAAHSLGSAQHSKKKNTGAASRGRHSQQQAERGVQQCGAHLLAECGGAGADALLPQSVVREVEVAQARLAQRGADDAQRGQRLGLCRVSRQCGRGGSGGCGSERAGHVQCATKPTQKWPMNRPSPTQQLRLPAGLPACLPQPSRLSSACTAYPCALNDSLICKRLSLFCDPHQHLFLTE